MSEQFSVGCTVVPVTLFEQNTSIVWCQKTMRGAFVDPGGEVERLLAAVAKQGVTIEKILVTHGHADHAGAVAELAERLSVPIEGPHREDAFWIDKIEEDSERYGMVGNRTFVPDRWLVDGDEVTVGEQRFQVFHCPGHTPGHVVFFHPEARFAWVGDVLFRGSIGRTDFPRGNHQALIGAIVTKLWPLGNDVGFLPGHGPTSTFGEERRSNPFVADHVLA